MLQRMPDVITVVATSSVKLAKLWHHMYRHLHFWGLNHFLKQKQIISFSKLETTSRLFAKIASQVVKLGNAFLGKVPTWPSSH